MNDNGPNPQELYSGLENAMSRFGGKLIPLEKLRALAENMAGGMPAYLQSLQNKPLCSRSK